MPVCKDCGTMRATAEMKRIRETDLYRCRDKTICNYSKHMKGRK